MLQLDKIQDFLKSEGIDGWLIADFHARNNIAVNFLGLSAHLTRRSFYFIPAEGEPVALVNNIEKDRFVHLPGRKLTYSAYKTLESNLKEILNRRKKIAMEYSARGRLPYIGLVDSGTVELVRSFGVEVVSSADIVAHFQARMLPEQVESHRKAAKLIGTIKDDAFKFIGESLERKQPVNEHTVVLHILRRFEENGLICDFPPTCAIDANISNPHYQPGQDRSSPIRKASLILIDLWAKLKAARSVYADITWMAYAGESVPEEYSRIFSIVTSARDRAIDFIRQKCAKGPVYGHEVDDACRKVITDAGYGDSFLHRTGHSILEDTHGPGPNIDNVETEDRRRLLPGHLFSVEPGIYLDNFGCRSEINCLLTESGPEITTQPVQKEIIPLLR